MTHTDSIQIAATCAMWVIAFMLAYVFARKDTQLKTQLSERALTTKGEVVKAKRRRLRGSKQVFLQVVYTFQAKNLKTGQARRYKKAVLLKWGEASYQVGEDIDVRYDSQDPSNSYLGEHPQSTIFGTLAGISFLFGLLFVLGSIFISLRVWLS